MLAVEVNMDVTAAFAVKKSQVRSPRMSKLRADKLMIRADTLMHMCAALAHHQPAVVAHQLPMLDGAAINCR